MRRMKKPQMSFNYRRQRFAFLHKLAYLQVAVEIVVIVVVVAVVVVGVVGDAAVVVPASLWAYNMHNTAACGDISYDCHIS